MSEPGGRKRLVLPIATTLLFLGWPTLAQERSPTERMLDAINRRSMEVLAEELKAPAAAISISVTASGCRWRFGYAPPNGAVLFDPPPCSTRLCALGLDPDRSPRIPVGQTVHLVVVSASAGRHLFAVPTLGLKVEAEYGKFRDAWVKATIAGNFVGVPSPGCENDPFATSPSIRAVEQRDFEAWLARLPTAGPSEPRQSTAEPKR